MKKFLLCSMCALLIFTSLFTVSAMKELNGWYVGDGFKLDAGGISPVTATVNADGTVDVKNGGWYTNEVSTFGGVASMKKYTLDGLKVEVQFTKACQSGDRWVCIGFLEKPDIFKTQAISTNRGYANLIRPKDKEDNSALSWQHIEAISSFSPSEGTPVATQFADNMKLTMEVKKAGDNYKFILNGVESPEYKNFANIFKSDAAYLVVAASGQNALNDDYQYKIKVTGNIAPDAAQKETPDQNTNTSTTKATAPSTSSSNQQVNQNKPAQQDTGKAVEEKKDEAETPEKDVAEDTSKEKVADVSEGIGGGTIAIIIIAAVVIIGAVVAIIVKKKKK